MNKLVPFLASLALLPACSSTAPDAEISGSTVAASAPMLGVPGGQDAADHECNVVLRSLARVPGNTGGYQTNCVPNSSCWYVWQGVLELSDAAVDADANPVVLFQSGSDKTWWKVEAEPMDDPDGRNLFAFTLDEHTVADGMSMTSLMRTRIEVTAAIEMPDDSRLFDHNRNPGDFDNYVLNADNSWSVKDDLSVCSSVTQRSALHFRSDWSNVQQGALVAGGTVTVDYDLQRLPQCFGSTYQGSPSWSTTGHARFLPGGQVVSGTVSEYDYDEAFGTRVVPASWQLPVPADAERVEFWFEVGGSSCDVHWDSNFGSNFDFPVEAAPINASVGWAGDGASVISRGMCESAATPGIPQSIVLDSWALTRADCMWVDIDVWAPGITDQSDQHPEWLEAQVAVTRDGGEPEHQWLTFVGRVGNNYRYRWNLWQGNDFVYTPWDRIDYGFRFSVDGNTWYEEGVERSIERDESWCPVTYWGEEKCS